MPAILTYEEHVERAAARLAEKRLTPTERDKLALLLRRPSQKGPVG
jgi:hypothetical protein